MHLFFKLFHVLSMFCIIFFPKLLPFGIQILDRQSWPIIPGSSASSLADVVVPSPQGWIKWWRKIMSHSGLHVWYIYLPWTVGFYGKFIGKIHKCPMDANANGCVTKKSEFQEWSQVKQPCLHKAILYPLSCGFLINCLQPRHCQNWMYSKKPSLPFESQGFIFSRTEGTNSISSSKTEVQAYDRTNFPTLSPNPPWRSQFYSMMDLGP